MRTTRHRAIDRSNYNVLCRREKRIDRKIEEVKKTIYKNMVHSYVVSPIISSMSVTGTIDLETGEIKFDRNDGLYVSGTVTGRLPCKGENISGKHSECME